jgi:hypothetical protein
VLKNRYENARVASLAAGVGGALAEAGASAIPEGEIARQVLAVGGGIMIAAMPTIASQRLRPRDLRAWLRARSVSEGLKTTIQLYLVGVERFSGDDRDSILQDRVDELLANVSGLQHEAARIVPDEPSGATSLNVGEYITQRVEGQAERYYRPKAEKFQRAMDRWRSLQFWLASVAAALGVIAGWLPSVGLWVGAITTASGSVAAHMAAGRYEHLTISYRITAQRLISLRNRWQDEFGESEGPLERRSQFVEDCEAAISVENQGWMADYVDQIDSPTKS